MIDLSTGYTPHWVDVEKACPYCQEKAKQYGVVKCDCDHLRREMFYGGKQDKKNVVINVYINIDNKGKNND